MHIFPPEFGHVQVAPPGVAAEESLYYMYLELLVGNDKC